MHIEWYVVIVLTILIIIISYKTKHLYRLNTKLIDDYNKLLSQKKSSEVRLGKTTEQLAPFFENWPFEPINFKFLGAPIDGISFESTGIYFIEIKTGKARLTPSQKDIKRLIKEGKVYFSTFRMNEDGSSFKVEED